MTVASRRLARRCRERFAANPNLLPYPAPRAGSATVKGTDVATQAQLEKVDAAK